MYYFPNECRVLKRTPYAYQYRVNGKIKIEGIASGAKMVNMPQYKHHDINSFKEFEFTPLFKGEKKC